MCLSQVRTRISNTICRLIYVLWLEVKICLFVFYHRCLNFLFIFKLQRATLHFWSGDIAYIGLFQAALLIAINEILDQYQLCSSIINWLCSYTLVRCGIIDPCSYNNIKYLYRRQYYQSHCVKLLTLELFKLHTIIVMQCCD